MRRVRRPADALYQLDEGRLLQDGRLQPRPCACRRDGAVEEQPAWHHGVPPRTIDATEPDGQERHRGAGQGPWRQLLADRDSATPSLGQD